MMTSDAPLIITPETRKHLKSLVQLADKRPVDVVALFDAIETDEGRKIHLDKMSEQTVMIPGPWDFFVTFSIENGHPVGSCRHMSMSINRPKRVPSAEAVWMIATELGFHGSGLEDATAVYPEKLSDGGFAINVLQKIPLLN